MNYFTATIPLPLAERLKEKGMLMEMTIPTLDSFAVLEDSAYAWLDEELGQKPEKVEKYYAKPKYCEVFDWLMEKGYRINIHTKPAINPIKWFAYIGTMHPDYCIIEETKDCNTWHEAANAAIEKALELIKQ